MILLPWRLAVLRRRRSGDLIVELIDATLSAGSTYLDVGANRGDYAAFAASRVGRSGLVVAVEPGVTHRVRLSRWAAARPGRVFLPAAVAAEPGVMTLSVPLDEHGNAMHWLATGRGELANARSELTTVITVDEIWRHVGPFHLVKIDVEGLESSVLAGMQDCLPAVNTLIIEIEARHCGEARLLGTLEQLGKHFPRGYFIRNGRLVELDEFDVTRDQIDLLSESNYSGESFKSSPLPAAYVSDFVFTRDATGLKRLP